VDPIQSKQKDTKMSKTMTLLAGFSLMVAACGGVEPGLGKPGDPGQDKEGTVSRTIVWLQSDGTAEVKTEEISRAQQQAEVAARQAMVQQKDSGSAIGTATQAVTVDPSCAPSSLWLFDDYNQTGANELCFFYGDGGIAYLSDYSTRYCNPTSCFFGNWRNSIRSYWAGLSGGMLWELEGDIFTHDPFVPWERNDYADDLRQHSYAVSLCPPDHPFCT